MIELSEHDGVTVFRMAHGPVNALDLELLAAFAGQLEQLEDAAAVVLTGSGSAFSAGVDLYRILDGGADYVEAFLASLVRAFEVLFTFPRPVVAAANGHAIAGGCILLCACDRRLVVDGRAQVGVSELRVGVPFPTIGLEVLRAAVGGRQAAELVLTGRTVEPAEALERGLVHGVVTSESLLDRAVEEAARLAAVPRETFTLTKQQLRQPALDRAAAHGAAWDAEAARLWQSGEAQAAMRAFADQTIGKGGR